MPRVQATLAKVGLYSLPYTANPFQAYLVDLSAFRDPMGQPDLRLLDGRDARVREWIKDDPRYIPLLHEVRCLVADVIGSQKKAWMSIAFRDHHGKWISPAVAELIGDELDKLGYDVSVTHVALPTDHPPKV